MLSIFKVKFEHFCTLVLCASIVFYKKFISPLQYTLHVTFGIECKCRFTPTCSDYALQCLCKYKPMFACWLIVKRLCRCHPFCKGGYDPVP